MTNSARARTRMSDESLETSKLLVEFLHATYATRRQDAGVAGGDGAGPNSKPAHPGDALATDHPMSAHAVRAAIHIYQHGVRTVGQLSSGLGISYGWASRVVDELEAAHFIVREPDPSDRRVVRVRLDEVALDRVERAYAWRGEAVSQALQPLTEAERTAVRTFLRRVIDLMREGDPNRVAEQAAPTDRSEPVQSPH